MALPTAPLAQDINLARARMLVHGPPKSGKSTLFSGWFPKTTLVIDFDDSWRLFPGDHFRVTPKSFREVLQIVTDLTTTTHQFTTVIIDTVTRMWRLADLEAGSRYGKNAAGVVDFGKGTSDRDGTIMRAVAPLLASPLGVVMVAHSEQVPVSPADDAPKKWAPRIDKKIVDDLVGGVDFTFFVDASDPAKRRLITNAGTPLVEAHSRFKTMPGSLELPDTADASALLLHQTITQAAKAQTTPAPAEKE